MKKIGRIVLVSVLWALVVAYVGYAIHQSRVMRQLSRVSEVEIYVRDSSQKGSLVNSQLLVKELDRSGIKTLGVQCDSVDLAAIERLLSANGFVENVSAHTTLRGVLKIDIEQRKPLFRLLVNGYNSYVTRDGFVFSAPAQSAHLSLVMTGGYRPQFKAGFKGYASDELDAQLSVLDSLIELNEQSKYPIYKLQNDNKLDRKDLRKSYPKKRFLESDEDFERRRVPELESYRARAKLYAYRERIYVSQIQNVEKKGELLLEKQKKVLKNYQDFINLIIFVNYVENDRFWGSEIVQVVANQSSNGSIHIELIPRSGAFKIIFGGVDGYEHRLDKLMAFYENGLSRVGWDSYRVINVEYDNQIVCY